jgi:hypothetical protein
MFQRIQTLYLFVSLGLVASSLFGLPLIAFNSDQTQVTVNAYASESADKLFGGQSKFYFVFLGAISLMLLFCLFSYSNRKIQRLFSWLSVLLIIGSLCTVYVLEYVSILNCTQCKVSNPLPALGFWIVVLAIPFVLLAIRGINKDQELVDSLDRLR